MKRFITSKKGLVLLATLVVAAAAAFGAYAYYTSSGSGSGTATAAATNGITFTITGGSTDTTNLFPGGSVPISNGDVHNGGAQAAGLLGPITGTVSIDPSASADALANCSPSWFSVDSVTVPANTSIAAGGDYAFTTTLHMTNPNTNQDSCEGAPLDITWSSS